MKIDKIVSCETCRYSGIDWSNWRCNKFNFIICDKWSDDIKKIHPDCKLENYFEYTIQTRFKKLLKLKWWEKYDIKFWILISKFKNFKQKENKIYRRN